MPQPTIAYMCSCVDLITLIFISKTGPAYYRCANCEIIAIGLKAVNAYQKRPNETMQLIMWIEFYPARDVWS